MKKISAAIMALVIIIALAACAATESSLEKPKGFSSVSEVTIERLIEATTASSILKTIQAFEASSTYENTGDPILEGAVVTNTFGINKSGIIEVGSRVSYKDGFESKAFFTNDPKDTNYYASAGEAKSAEPMDEGYTDSICGASLLGYSKEETTIDSVREENGLYIAELSASGTKDTVTLDPKTGRLLRSEAVYKSVKGDGESVCTTEFSYEDGITVDDSPKTANIPAEGSTAEAAAKVDFETTDLYEKPVTNDIIKGSRLVLLNFWEPWCGPCVGEMPDLEALYEKYKDQGLLITGVYSTFAQDADAIKLIEEKSITYPILRCSSKLAALQKNYVPATYFVDGEGNLLSPDPVIGAKSYDEWEKLILEYLNK